MWIRVYAPSYCYKQALIWPFHIHMQAKKAQDKTLTSPLPQKFTLDDKQISVVGR